MYNSAIPKKTLIVAQGLERERILAAVSYHSPTKLIILRNTEDVKMVQNQIEHVLSQIKADLNTKSQDGIPLFPLLKEIDDTNERCNFFDLFECIAKIDLLIKREREQGATVVIDVSSGNKIVAIALYIAAALNNVPVTYFIAGKYAEAEGLAEQYAYSVKGHRNVFTLPLSIKPIHFDILKKINSVGGYTESAAALSINRNKKESISIARCLRTLEAMGYVVRLGKGYKISLEGREVLKLKDVTKPYIQRRLHSRARENRIA
jgi:hypothetical protein